MKIEYAISPDGTLDGKLDPDDLLGEVRIIGDQGFVMDEMTYIDSWLKSLILAVIQIDEGMHSFSIDLIVEPDALNFRIDTQGLSIDYGQQRTHIKRVTDFKSAVLAAVVDLLANLHSAVPEKSIAGLSALIDFARSNRATQ